jgi:endoglucanase
LKRWCKWVFLATVVCAGLRVSQAQQAFQRAQHLKRGINLSMWYAQSSDYSAARLASYTTPQDFALVRALGFDHVRVSIDPVQLIAEKQSGSLNPAAMERLDKTVGQLTALGLAVVLDIHPEEAFEKDVVSTEEGRARFFNFWHNFAHHYATTDPSLVYFEILNEPHDVDAYRWSGEQARLVEIIRSQAPQHTIIAGSGNYDSLDSLVATEPVRDDNVIYTFHFYQPFEFTHQGASWAGVGQIYLRHVPYPSSPDAVAPLLASEPDEVARVGLARYGLERWNAGRIAGEVSLADEWARTRHVPLWCGEFGAYTKNSLPEARAQWIGDVRRGLEASGIGWAMWDYQGSFALVTKSNGEPVADPAIVKALGLRPQ